MTADEPSVADLVVDRATVSPGDPVAFTIHNRGTAALIFGLDYVLSRTEGGGWIGVPNAETGLKLARLGAEPGDSKQLIALIPEGAVPGRYRISKELEVFGTDRSITVAGETTVV
jgi:hypothetical protein